MYRRIVQGDFRIRTMNYPVSRLKLVVTIFLITLLFSFYQNESCTAGEHTEYFSKYAIDIGDKLNIQVNGKKEQSGIFEVNSKGDIDYPEIGPMSARGLSLEDFEKLLTNVLEKNNSYRPVVRVVFSELHHAKTSQGISISDGKPPQKIQNKINSKLKKSPAEELPRGPDNVRSNDVSTATHAAASPTLDSDIIEVRDRLNIQVYKQPVFSGTFVVTSTGKINYPMLGEIEVQSLSIDQLNRLLCKKLQEDYVTNPQIEITFLEDTSRSVSILGQVVSPGTYTMPHHPLTLLGLLAQVGGFTINAETKTVRIVRAPDSDKKETILVDADSIIQGQTRDVFLKTGDIIFVDYHEKKQTSRDTIHVTILGQVSRPGNYNFDQNPTLILLIASAGGFSPVAAANRVNIVRKLKNHQTQSLFVDAGAIMRGVTEDVDLTEGDLIVVPESFF